MSQPRRATHSRRRRYPRCQITGLSRFGERKDACLAVEASRYSRSRAERDGAVTSWGDLRYFRCPACSGFHLARSIRW